MTTMGQRIKEIRKLLGMTQDELALFFGVGKSYISAVENDKSKLSVENLVKLLVNHKVNINYVLGGIGEPVLNLKNKTLKEEILSEVRIMLKTEGLIS